MKYILPSFSTAAPPGDAYRDSWERTFGKKADHLEDRVEQAIAKEEEGVYETAPEPLTDTERMLHAFYNWRAEMRQWLLRRQRAANEHREYSDALILNEVITRFDRGLVIKDVDVSKTDARGGYSPEWTGAIPPRATWQKP